MSEGKQRVGCEEKFCRQSGSGGDIIEMCGESNMYRDFGISVDT